MKKIALLIAIMAASAALVTLFMLLHRKAQLEKLDNTFWSVSEKISSELSPENKIRQMFVLYIELDKYDTLEKIMPGAIFVHNNNIPRFSNGEKDYEKLPFLIEKIHRIYMDKQVPPPLYSIDEEGGYVRRISSKDDFPSAMTIGEAMVETGKNDLSMLAGFYTCLKLRKYGISWNFAPVADVQSNPENPVIGARSFGSDPELVYEATSSYLEGLTSARCLGSIKHFPGHGDTSLDSHKNLPYVNKNPEELKNKELFPFKKVVQNNPELVHSIMTAHIVYPEVDDKPATFSYKWLTGKLKNEWEYKGIIVTDDLGMNAVNIYAAKNQIDNPAVEIINAGADMLLYFGSAAESEILVNKLITFYETANPEFKNRIQESVKKIIYYKLKSGIIDHYLDSTSRNWKPEEKQMVEVIKQYSYEIENRIDTIEKQLPDAISTNKFISEHGIKTIIAPETLPKNLQSEQLFTDLDEKKIDERLLKKFKNVLPLSRISESNCSNYCMVLITTKNKIESLPMLRSKTGKYIIYSLDNPFPSRKYKALLQQEDIFITTFSNTDESVSALINMVSSKYIPPKAAVLY